MGVFQKLTENVATLKKSKPAPFYLNSNFKCSIRYSRDSIQKIEPLLKLYSIFSLTRFYWNIWGYLYQCNNKSRTLFALNQSHRKYISESENELKADIWQFQFGQYNRFFKFISENSSENQISKFLHDGRKFQHKQN